MGAAMAVAAVVELAWGEGRGAALAVSAATTLAAGEALLRILRPARRPPLTEVFAAVGAAWVVGIFVAAVPYLVTNTFAGADDALFEAVSGMTTTSTTVLDVEEASRGILLWRALTQWLGGAAAVVMAVTVLPFLGVGGADVQRGLPTGLRSERFLARAGRAFAPLGRWYLAFTAGMAGAYLLAGMGAFDAVAHALTTVSTGGMSTRVGSLGAYGSPAVEWVATVGMITAGASVAMVAGALRTRRSPAPSSAETRTYLALVGGASFVAVVVNLGDASLPEVVRSSVFTVASYASTTGFLAADVNAWVPGLQALLLVLVGVGSMTGSPGGGFKVFRLIALVAYVRRELVRQLHSSAVLVVRTGKEVVGEEVLQRMVGYQAVFSLTAALVALGVATSGTDLLTALSGAITSVSNAGPGLGELSDPSAVAGLSGIARASMALGMLAGRLEVFPLVVGLGALFDWVAPRRRRRLMRARSGRLGRG